MNRVLGLAGGLGGLAVGALCLPVAADPAQPSIHPAQAGIPGPQISQTEPLTPVPSSPETIGPETIGPETISPETSLAPSPGLNHAEPQPYGQTNLDLEAPEPMAQVSPVAAFEDVPPDHWAAQALQILIQKYGVLAGYPDGTFRGDRSISRFEFAAAIAQLLETLENLKVDKYKDDITTLKRLQAIYATMGANLGDRLDQLAAKNQLLAAQQFATTTQITGQTVLNFTDGSDARGTLVNRSRLGLTTYFSPTDQLFTQLEFGNGKGDAIAGAQQQPFPNLLGTAGVLADGGGLDYVQVSDALRLSKLYYRFAPNPSLRVAVGAKLSPRDFIDKNRFANDSASNFATSFFANNPLVVQNAVDRTGGAGIAVEWQLPQQTTTAPGSLILRGVYVAADASRPQPGLGEGVEIPSGPLVLLPPNLGVTQGGLWGDRRQATLEAEYAVRPDMTLRAQYTNARIHHTEINALGLNGEWQINQQFGAFARLGWAHYKGFNTLLQRDLDAEPITWAIGGTARNLIFPGTLAGVALGQPFITRQVGSKTQTNFEAFYSVLLNDRVSVTPGLILLNHPNNRDEGLLFEWYMRVVYSF